MKPEKTIDDIAEELGNRFVSGAELFMEYINTMEDDEFQQFLASLHEHREATP
jgi:hypothetical protein